MPSVVLIVNPYSTGVEQARLEQVEAELGKVADVERKETDIVIDRSGPG